MRDVAARAGVAISSVSRVLADHPDVSATMRQRVMEAVDALGYRPNLLAQSMRRQETMSIGFVVSTVSNPVLAMVVAGAERHLRRAGYSLLLTDSDGDASLDPEHIALLAQRRVDGLLLAMASEEHLATFDVLRTLDIPAVLVDREAPQDLKLRGVYFDHHPGMRDATARLLDLGHRDIGLILGSPVRPTHARLEAFYDTYDTYKEHGLPIRLEHILRSAYSEEYGAAAMTALLDSQNPPTAVIVGGNQIAVGALDVLADRRIEVGRDLSFVGCDDLPVSRFHHPPLAVIRRDNRMIGSKAAEVLLATLYGEDTASVVLPTEFIERPSVGPPRSTN